MQKLVENWSLVLLGNWNPSIFTGTWLTELLGPGELRVQVSVANPLQSLRYSHEGLRFQVTDQVLTFSPVEDSKETLDRMEQIARETLERLPHTPVRALGINFHFREDSPDTDLLQVFQFSDLNALSDADFLVQRSIVQRRLTFGEGLSLNLNMTQEQAQVTFEFNFHQDVANAAAAQQWLDGKVLSSRAKAIDVLGNVYNFDEEGLN